MSSATASSTKSPLDAAQKIVAELTGMIPEQQALALKFATETLELAVHAAISAVTKAPVQSPQLSPLHVVSGAGHSPDIKSFTSMKAPKSDQQFAAVVAYFYQFESKAEERTDAIDAEVMRNAARLVNRPQAPQWTMTLNNAKNAGYLDTAGSGKFKLSSVGENLVAITLPSNGGTALSNSNTSKKKPKKKSSKSSVKNKK